MLMFALLIRATAIAQAPVAAFSPDDSIVCVGIDITFTDMSTGGVGPLTWNWDFGDAGTSTSQNPIHSYVSGGIKVVTLNILDSLANSSTYTDTIYVMEAQTSQSTSRVCSPVTSTTITAVAPINSAITGYWFAGGSAIIADPLNDTTLVSNLSNGSNIIFWVVTDGFCSDADQTVVYVDLPLTPNAGPDQTVCSSVGTSTMAATNPAPGTGAWTTSSSASITSPTVRTSGITGLTTAGNYDFVWTVTNGACVTTDIIRIVVTNYEAAVAGADQNVCQSPGTATLTGNTPITGSVQWTTTGSAVINSPTSPATTISGLTTVGIQTFIYTITNGTCVSRDTVLITSNLLLTSLAGNNLQVCTSTGTATLNGNNPAPGSGLWSTTSSATITSPASASTGVTGLTTAGNYFFVWSITNGTCVSRDTMLIIVRAPIVSNAGPDQTFCNTSTATLAGSATGGGSGAWTTTGSATITTPSSPSSTVSNLAYGDNYFIWTITIGACVSRDTVRIHRDQRIVADAGSDQSLCQITAATLAGNSAAPGTGTWTTSSTAVITSPNSATSTVSSLTVGTSQFVWTIVNGTCTTRDTMIIVVSSVDTARAGSDQTLCLSTGSTSLSGNTPAIGTGTWTTSSSATIVSASNPTTSVTGLNTAGVYTFIWTISNGACISRDTVSFTIDIAQLADAGPDQQLCETTTSTTMAANAVSAGTGTWTTTSGATITSINNPSSTITGLSVGSFEFVWTISNGSCLSSDTMTIVVDVLEIADAGIDQQVCSSPGTATLAAIPAVTGTGVWFTTGSALITDPLDPNTTVSGLTTAGIYEFIWMINNGVCLSVDTMLITVDDLAIADAGADQNICETDPVVQLNAATPSAGMGVWISLGVASADDPLDPNSTVTGAVLGTNTFVWMVSNGLCLSTDTTDINISEFVVADAGVDQQLCSGATTTNLNGNNPSSGTGVWFTTSSAGISDPLDPNTAVTGLAVAGNYEFIWMINNGACLSSDTMIVTIDSVIADAGTDQDICETDPVVQLSAATPTVGLGVWVSLGVASLDDPLDPNSTVTGAVLGINSFVWMVSNGLCLSSDTIDINVNEFVVSDAGVDQQICSSPGSTNLSGNVPSAGTGVWFTTSAALITDPLDPNTAVTGLTVAGNYEFIWMINNGTCLSIDTMIVVVDDNVIADAGADQDICETNPVVQLNAATPSSGMGVWISLGVASVDNPLDPQSTVTGTVLGTNSFVWMVSNGVCLTSDTTDININAMIAADAGIDQQICASPGIANLIGSDPAPGSSFWLTTSSATITDASSDTTTATGMFSAGNYEFIYTTVNGACLSSDTMIFAVDDSVIPDAGPDQYLCETTTSTNLAAALPVVGAGVWITTSPATLADPLDPATLVSNLTIGVHEFVWMVSNGMCLSTDTIYIYVDSLSTPSNAGLDISICANQDSVQLNGNSPLVGTGVWNTSTTAIISNPSDSMTWVSGLAVGANEIHWMITNGGCFSYDTMIVTVLPTPVADAGADLFTISGNSVVIGGSPSASGGNAPYTYSWTPGSDLNDSLNANPTATSTSTTSFILTVTDSLGCAGNDTMTLYINDPPVAADDTISGLEDSVLVINVLQNDTDPNNNLDTVGLGILTGPIYGTTSVDTITGAITYTPNANYNGADSLQYVVCDTGLPVYCDTAWVYINIQPVNDAPVALDDSYTTMEDSCISFNVLSNDTDVENDLNLASFATLLLPVHGVLTLDTVPGMMTYCPDSSFNGADTLVYIICDNGNPVLCDTALVIINVNPLDNTPVASDDNISMCAADSMLIDILANDFDQEGDSVFITILTPPSNGSATVDPSSMISYSPGSSFSGSDSVQYSICQVSNPALCSTAWVWISVHALPVLTTTHVNPLCASDSTGSVDLTVTGTSPFVYQWSNLESTEDIDSLIAGIYTVVVIDTFGCSGTMTDTVGPPNPLQSSFITNHVNCFGDSTASIDLNVSGGTAPYTISWSNGELTEDIDSLIAGIYTVNITDSNGCVLQNIDTIQEPSAALTASASVTGVNCAGDSTGTIDISVTGGTPGYQYSWSNGYVTEDLASMIAGTYTVNITDTNGCAYIYVDSITSTIPPVSITYTSQNAICIDNVTGLIDVAASGGLSPYTYLWSTAETTEDISNLFGGSYTLTLTDSVNCMYTITVNVLDSSVLLITAADSIICQGSTMDIIAPANSFVTYQWLNGTDTISGGTNATLTTDSGGIYTVIATAICGTFTSNSINILVNPLPIISVTDSLITNCDSAIVLTAAGGVAYVWLPSESLNNANISQPVANPQSTTIYIVTVTDSNGCSATENVLVDVTCDTLSVPGGISPNGDGYNEFLVITDIENYPGNRLRIFNRWGNIVYDKTDYDNSWNGNSNVNSTLKGETLTEGTYFYVLDLNIDRPPYTGFIVLKR